MSFLPIYHTLKSGEEVLIREATTDDAEKLIKLAKGYIKNTKSIPIYPDEFEPSIEYEANWIDTLIKEKNSQVLLAEYNGELIGNIDLHGNQRRKLFHTAWIGMGIDEEHRGKGLGTILMQELIEWCQKNEHLRLLWLEAYTNNSAGVKLYEKMGFEKTGIRKDFFKESDGSYIDNIMLTLHLND